MATLAFGCFVFVFEDKAGLVVFEARFVEYDYLGIAALVVGMAGAAIFVAFFKAAVVALFRANIRCGFLVAIKAQASLRLFVETLVAVLAFFLIFRMALNYRARHQCGFSGIGRRPMR